MSWKKKANNRLSIVTWKGQDTAVRQLLDL